MRFRKRLAAMLLAGTMAVSSIPAGVYAEGSEGEWTEEDTFNSLLYDVTSYVGATWLDSDHAEAYHAAPIMHIDARQTSLGALTGSNSILLTADQLKSETYKDKICLSFQFTFENHLNFFPESEAYSGKISLTSVDGSFTAAADIYRLFETKTGKCLYWGDIACSKQDIRSGVIIRFTDESEDSYWDKGLNKYVRMNDKPLYLRAFEIRNGYSYEKVGELSGISGDLDALGSIAIPSSTLANYPVDNEQHPGALLCYQWEMKPDAKNIVEFEYFTAKNYYTMGFAGADIVSSQCNLIPLKNDLPKKNGLTVKYSDNESHGAILKSVSVFLPVGVDYPEAGGYQSVGESIAALGTGKLSVQKTSVKDGKYDARFIQKIGADELSGKSKAVFSLSNGTKTASVSTDKYYTSLTADGEAVSAESGTVFLAYTVKDIPENINITVSGVTLE